MVTPFLPGDSLLFAAGALAAVDTSGTLSAPLLSLMLVVAAVAGNTTNYHIGRWIGPPAFSGKIPLPQGRLPAAHRGVLREARLDDHRVVALRAHHPHLRAVRRGHRAACRTRASRPTTSSAALAWVLLLTWAGYFFGNIPLIKDNFGLVTIGIIVVSTDPGGVGGAEEVSSAYRSFAHRVDIGVPVERVWRAFTDSRCSARWSAAGATVTPREKGRMHVMFGAEHRARRAHRRAGHAAAHAPDPAAHARHAEHRRGHRRRLPVRAGAERRHRGAAAEQRSALGPALGDVLSVQAPLLGAGADPAQGVPREGTRSGTATPRY